MKPIAIIASLLLATTVALSAAPAATVKTFATPQQAAAALIAAADKFDVAALEQLFGPSTKTVIFSDERAQDRQRAAEFVAKAREKEDVSIDPKNRNRAFLLIGKDNWPFPVPLVKRGAKWSFDTAAGRHEILYRRIGSNELDAIAICRGYVEAQHEYALKKRDGYDVNQYAQRIISTPGTQDGLAWKNPDGTWGGPVGDKVASAIEQGYSKRGEPYHGYFFKILKGQGPAAPLGQLDYVVKGAMIGGFALAAAPAEYGVTGVKTFIVSQDGVVYEKDLGPKTLEAFSKIERFNPDRTWKPVLEE
jgi:surface antigen